MEGSGMSRAILYYTGNFKAPKFTAKIVDRLIENSNGLPIISVSHQPMNLGVNICVGDVGKSYLNAFRQMLIGAQHSEADYLIFAEDDFLYPPEYFQFTPNGEDFYRSDNTWLVLNRGPFYRSRPIGGAQICKRSFVIRELENYLKGQVDWLNDPEYRPQKLDWNGKSFKLFSTPPIVCFKTEGNLSNSGVNAGNIKHKSIPYWGEVNELRKSYGI
jgi:hypothetical protein